jgi:two-component system sensor histidine kinase PilS (NtrC family)
LLKIVSDNVARLNRIVTDVLRLNRGERAHTEQFPIADFLTTFVKEFIQNEKIDAGIFEVKLEASPKVLFDRSHLNQVMWNLCRNALRHCRGETGSIHIIVNVIGEGNVVKLDVVDDGPGVPPTVRSHLFEPFFTTVATGTGLGLYIAREICEANGATLECVEVAEGAHFTILCQGA